MSADKTKLSNKDYEKELERLQAELVKLQYWVQEKGLKVIVVFEGRDAAGKGGLIKRITERVSPRVFRVVALPAPTEREKTQLYIQRYITQLPAGGEIVVFDRSWYGRVLVERIEGFATEAQWQRAYAEINDFEEQLVEHGALVQKFWLHIDPDEQMRRFEAREQTPYKKYKITEEDYRNREQWDAYEHAVNDMVERTSTEFAPWTLIFPAAFLTVTLYCFNYIGDGMRDALDPKDHL